MKLHVPQEIIEAERKISRWFTANNVKDWELGNSKSRCVGLDAETLAKLQAWAALADSESGDDEWQRGYNAARHDVATLLRDKQTIPCEKQTVS